MVRFRFTGDAYYQLGVQTLMKELSYWNLSNISVNTLHFPDMRYLLAWSRSPVLPSGMTLITGNTRVIDTLKGIISPVCTELSGSDDSLESLRDRLKVRLALAVTRHPQVQDVREVRLSTAEMSYMWGLMNGHTPMFSIKKDSLLRRSVMTKIGAENLVALMVRFRLLFALAPEQRCMTVRMAEKYPGIYQPVHAGDMDFSVRYQSKGV